MRFEKTSARSILGLRFRDAATERPVTSGLDVTVRRKRGPGGPTRAVRTVSGAYVAQGLAGLRAYERTAADIPDNIPDDTPHVDHRVDYLVDVHDARGRYLPVLLNVKLPYTPDPERGGLYSIVETPSDIDAEAGEEKRPESTCYLFSAVQRPVTAGRAVLYADLVVQGPGNELQPAAHAVLEVLHDPDDGSPNGARTWYGVADTEGRAAVQFPLPPVTFETLSSGGGGSASAAPGGQQPLSKLAAHTWPLTLRVRYEPIVLTVPETAERPLLPSIFRQNRGTLFADPSTEVTERSVTLSYGEPLIVTSGDLPDDRRALRVAPHTGT